MPSGFVSFKGVQDDKTTRGARSGFVPMSPDVLAAAVPVMAQPATAEPEASTGGRHPIRAGLEAAKTGLGTGLPYALERIGADAGISTLTPEEEANYRAELQASAAKQEQLLPGGAMSLDELGQNPITGLPRFVGENLGQSIPQSAGALIGGIAGGIGGAAIGTSVAPGPGTVAGGIAGAAIGGAAVGTPQFIGSNVDRATAGGTEALTHDEAVRSVAVAPLQAGADALISRVLPGSGAQIGGNLLARAAKGAVAGAGTEAITEAGQQVGERYAAGLDLGSREAMGEYATAAGTAAILGGSIGGASGPFNGERQPAIAEPERAVGTATPVAGGADPADLLRLPAPTPQRAPLGGTTLTNPAVDEQFSESALTEAMTAGVAGADGAPDAIKGEIGRLSKRLAAKMQAGDVEGVLGELQKEQSKIDARRAALEEDREAVTADVRDGIIPAAEARTYLAKHTRTAFALDQRQKLLDPALEIAVRFEASKKQYDAEFAGPAVDPAAVLVTPPVAQEPVVATPAAAPAVAEPGVNPPVTLVTEPAAPVSFDPAPLQAPPAADTALADGLRMEAANTVSAQAKARTGLLDKVLGDANTRNPTRRYLAELKRAGLDPSLTAEEAERVARYEDAKAGFTDETQADPYVLPSAPDESGNFGIPERKAPAAPAPPAAAAVEPAAEPEAQVETNVRTRASTHADTLGSSRRAWFLKGADSELGIVETPRPSSKSKAAWYDEGREFARQEAEQQRRERGGGGSRDADTAPAVADKPKPAAKPTRSTELKAKQAAKIAAAKVEAAPEPTIEKPPPRGGKSKFVDAVARAEQERKISPQEGMALRTMADMDWDQEMWGALDTAIAERAGKPSATKFMYAGSKAATANKAKGVAAKLGILTRPAEAVRKATGWFQGADNMWRFEISDRTAKLKGWKDLPAGKAVDFKGENSSYTLAEVLDHPELFKAYPELKAVKVTKNPMFMDMWGATQGWFDPKTGVLNITPNASDPLSTMLHEIQHWIQTKEGWHSGGNPNSVRLDNSRAMEKLRKFYQRKIAEMGEAPVDAKSWTQADAGNVRNKIESRLERVQNLLADPSEVRAAYERAEQLQADLDAAQAEVKAVADRFQSAYDAASRAYNTQRDKLRAAYEAKDAEIKAAQKAGGYARSNALVEERSAIHRQEMALQRPTMDWAGRREAETHARARVEEIRVAQQAATKALDGIKGAYSDISFDLYQLIGGEREARDTQARIDMSARDRQDTAPYSDEGIRDDEAIIAYDDTPSADTRFAQSQMAAIHRDLRAELDRMGLSDVAMHVRTLLGMYMSYGSKDVRGAYLPAEQVDGIHQLIVVGMHDDPMGTLHHEAIHALREMDLFTPAEWTALETWAGKDMGLRAWAESTYAELTPEAQREEMVAEAVSRWMAGERAPQGPVSKALRAIRNVIKAIGRALNLNGYRDIETLLQDIHSGEVGKRRRGPTLTAQGRDPDGRARRLPGPVQQSASNMVTNLQDFGAKSWLWVMQTRDMAKVASKLLPSAVPFIDALSRSHALARSFEDRLGDIKRGYEKLPSSLQGNGPGTVNRYLMDTRMAGKWGYKPDWIAKPDIDPEIEAKFNALPKSAQDVVKAVLRFNKDARDQLAAATVKAVRAEYDPLIAAATTPEQKKSLEDEAKRKLKLYSRVFDAKQDEPYTPLGRSGDFVAVGWSAEFDAAKKAKDTKTMDELRSQPDHYWVNFYGTKGQAKAMAEKLRASKFAHTEHFERDQVDDLDIGGDDLYLAFSQMRERLTKARRDAPSDETIKALYQLATDMYLHALSDTSARKAELKADKVGAIDPITGEGLDMMKSFVSRGQATAHFVAQLENSVEIQRAIENMHSEAEATSGTGKRDEAQRLKNELLWHYTQNINRKPSRAMDAALRMNSIWTLLTKPGYYFQNATQTYMISLPQIAAVAGYGRAQKLVFDAYTQVAPLMDNWIGDLMDIRPLAKTDPEAFELAKYLQDHGAFGTGMAMELGQWEMNGNGLLPKTWNPVDRALRKLPQNVEDVNRLVAGIAAWRAMKAKGKSETAAREFAAQVIYDTHGDYSNLNSPRAVKELPLIGQDATRLVMQFRKFQFIMASLHAKMFYNAFRDPAITDEQRWVARRALAYTLAHETVVAGLKGLPGYAFFGAAVMALTGKDPEELDEEVKAKLEAFFGKDSPMVGLLLKGAPYKLLNLDLSETLGMGQIISPAPYTEWNVSDREGFFGALGQLATGSLGGTLWRGVQGIQRGKEGDYYKMLEGLAPSGVANAMKAARYSSEGVTANNGDTLIRPDDLTGSDKFLTALSLPAANLKDHASDRSTQYRINQRFDGETTRMKRKWAAAAKAGDRSEMAKLRGQWAELQDEREAKGLKRQPIATLLKAAAEQRKRERNTRGGLQFTPADRKLVENLTE